MAWRRLQAPRAEMFCHPPFKNSERTCPATVRSLRHKRLYRPHHQHQTVRPIQNFSSSRFSSSKPRGRCFDALPAAVAKSLSSGIIGQCSPKAKPKSAPTPRPPQAPSTPPPPPRASTLCEHCGREFPVSERNLHSWFEERSRWCAICFLLEDCHRAWTEEYGPVPPQVRDRFEDLLTMALCELRTFRAEPLGWPVAAATAATSSSTAAPPLE